MRYKIGEFAAKLKVHTDTLRRWDNNGKLVAQRSVGGTRYYTDEHFQKALRLELEEKPKKNVIYCRVSSPNQKDDLQGQIQAMETFALGRGLITETITEIGGGMNFSRKKFTKLITDIINGDVGTVIVAHKDRLARFGFEMVDNLAKEYGCEIIVVNREELSPQQEMVEDLMAIIHTFCAGFTACASTKKQRTCWAMKRAHKIRIYPNNVQRTALHRHCGCARLAYNVCLAKWNEDYGNGIKHNYYSIKKWFNAIKREKYPFVYEISKWALEAAIADLDSAFKKFFSKQNARPTFHKKGIRDSFRIDGSVVKIDGNVLCLPKGLRRHKPTRNAL